MPEAIRPRPSAVAALLGTAIVAQIAYPLVTGPARDSITVSVVCLVSAAALVHAGITRGTRAMAVLAGVCVAGGFAVEVLGVRTGVPFGRYGYAATLGPKVAGVPLVISLAWAMIAWPAALAARRLCRGFAARVAVGAWALAAWDLFLDPQMVAAGHWHWTDPTPHLPGVPGVPLSDFAGWLVVSAVISLALQGVLRSAPSGDDRWPLGFYVWTWASSTLGLAVFLGLPAAAGWGGVAMGAVAVPLAVRLARSGWAPPSPAASRSPAPPVPVGRR